MTRSILLLPLLAAACAGPQAMTSYVSLGRQGDAWKTADTINSYVSAKLPAAHTTIAVMPSGAHDPIFPLLVRDLRSDGFAIADPKRPGGANRLAYQVSPFDGGELVRVSIDGRHQASRFLTRSATGNLMPGGPYTVREASK